MTPSARLGLHPALGEGGRSGRAGGRRGVGDEPGEDITSNAADQHPAVVHPETCARSGGKAIYEAVELALPGMLSFAASVAASDRGGSISAGRLFWGISAPITAPVGGRRHHKMAERLVGVAGFEPAAPSSRTRCATRLRYTPYPGGAVLYSRPAAQTRRNRRPSAPLPRACPSLYRGSGSAAKRRIRWGVAKR